jgi:hypothetical protein
MLRDIERKGQVAFRYCDQEGRLTAEANPNGSLASIAGVANDRGNVVALMPHPERAVEACLGSTDGLALLGAVRSWMKGRGSKKQGLLTRAGHLLYRRNQIGSPESSGLPFFIPDG